MTEIIAEHIGWAASYAHTWGFFLIFFFMAVESSFIPFPSEVVMIPAGFLAYRSGLTFQVPWLDCVAAIGIGLAGSMAGAYINYYLAAWLGRPFLHKYGRYFFLPEPTLNRAEEIFRRYGELATFVCRLLPGIRQLISIPAGLVRMNFWRFSLFTALGAGLWIIVLTLIGWYFGHLAGDMSYLEMVERGKAIISENYVWVILGLAVLVAAYLTVHHKVMKSDEPSSQVAPPEA